MPNELEPGTRRSGSLIDFNPDTPEVTVTLEHNDQGIDITIPWSDESSPYSLWFTSKNGIKQIPPPPDPPPFPPRAIFHDSHGSVLLLRLWMGRYHANLLGGPGAGHLHARAAVMGVHEDIDFDHPHGLQSEISGLQSWLGISSWQQKFTWPEEGTRTVEVRTELPPDTVIGEYDNCVLSFRSGWKLSPRDDQGRIVLHDLLYCVTESDVPLAWSAHEQPHRALRDLLVVSRWRDESCVVTKAQRRDDLVQMPGDDSPGTVQWRDVVIPDGPTNDLPSGHRPHLIEYADVGPAGVMRWLELRDEFSRAIDPVITSIGLRGTTANTMLAHTGPGLEALGYLLILRDTGSKKKARDSTLRQRFERILEDLGDCMPFDTADWAERMADTYNGIKHANRNEPDALEVVNAWRECVLVVRAWIAVELGVEGKLLKDRLLRDPQRHRYVSVFDD